MEQKTLLKCTKCHKEITEQDAVKTSKGVICNTCRKKLRVRTISICSFCILLIIACIYLYMRQSNQNNAIGFHGVTEIQDSIKVEVEKPANVFVLENTIAQSTPIIVEETINNIESFRRMLKENINEAEAQNSNSVIIPNINLIFDINSAAIYSTGKDLLKEYAIAYLQTNKEAQILINGYACNLGNNNINNIVSKKRAESVRDFLVSIGVPKESIDLTWYGKSKNNEFSYNSIEEYRRVIVAIK